MNPDTFRLRVDQNLIRNKNVASTKISGYTCVAGALAGTSLYKRRQTVAFAKFQGYTYINKYFKNTFLLCEHRIIILFINFTLEIVLYVI